jgi:hypothetical protein
MTARMMAPAKGAIFVKLLRARSCSRHRYSFFAAAATGFSAPCWLRATNGPVTQQKTGTNRKCPDRWVGNPLVAGSRPYPNVDDASRPPAIAGIPHG